MELVYDAIGLAETQTLGFEVLAPGGALVTTLATNIPEDVLKAGADKNKKVVNVFGSVHHAENRDFGVELYSRLTELLRTGAIVVRLRFFSALQLRDWERMVMVADWVVCLLNAAEPGRGRPWGPCGHTCGPGPAEAEQRQREEARRPSSGDGVIASHTVGSGRAFRSRIYNLNRHVLVRYEGGTGQRKVPSMWNMTGRVTQVSFPAAERVCIFVATSFNAHHALLPQFRRSRLPLKC